MTESLSTTLRAQRLARELSQAQLADRAGIHPSYLSRIESAAWERNGPCPSDSVLRGLGRVLGVSPSELIHLRDLVPRRAGSKGRGGTWARANCRSPFSVAVGDEQVQASTRRLIERNPKGGTFRFADVLVSEEPHADRGPDSDSGMDALGARLADDPGAMLRRVCTSDRENLELVRSRTERLAGGRVPGEVANIRTRFTFASPLVLDVLIGEHEVLVAVPDRRGHPYRRASITVDCPDFVAALRDWFDELIWDGPGEALDLRYGCLSQSLASIVERVQ